MNEEQKPQEEHTPKYAGHKSAENARKDSKAYYERHKDLITKRRMMKRLKDGYNVNLKTLEKNGATMADLLEVIEYLR